MALTETTIRNAKARARDYKMTDGNGLSLLVKSNGGKWWRFRYRFNNTEKMISFGQYPDVSLKRARDKRSEARKLLDQYIDPSSERQAKRNERGNTFGTIAREWLDMQGNKLAPVTLAKAEWMLNDFVLATLGKRPIRDIGPPEILRVLRRVESKGLYETAHRTRQRISQVFRYAVATGRADRDMTLDLRGALTPIKAKHRAAITDPVKVGELLRAIDAYDGNPSIMYALRLLALVFVRPGELRGARWEEISFKNKEWRIPAARMKMNAQHIVPLSTQTVDLLRELEPLTAFSDFLFPSVRTPSRPISDNTLNATLRRIGYSKDEQTAHGFRTIASTLLNELGFHPDIIEHQLAHAPRDKVRAAYNRAERLPERRKMMQSWADYLDGLKADKVTTLNSRRAV